MQNCPFDLSFWGIVYTRPFPDRRLPTTTCPPIPAEKGLPSFLQPETPAQLMGFVDAAHANDLRNRRSTYGIEESNNKP